MNIRPVLRASLFFTVAIVIAELLNMQQVVLCVFLGPAIISGHKFSLRVSVIFLMRILAFVVVGMLVGEMFYNNQMFAVMLSASLFWCLMTGIKYPSKIMAYTSPVFLYCYAFINTTSGLVVENTILELLQGVSFMIPLGWLCFKLFPSDNELPKTKSTAKEPTISELHKLLIVVLITCALVTFLTMDIGGAIFCLSVVINAALRSSIKQGKLVVQSIIPVQITGCLMALLFHLLLLGHPNNIALFALLLFVLTSVVHYFSFHKELRHKDIPNFEVGFMSAVLVPVTLYTQSNGFHVEPFVERMFDMACIWAVLNVIVYFVLRHKRKNHPVSTN
ncbi:hypothetical protein L1D37_07145 [Vibrio sp. Isolate33]|uniref:hypothetical protein n=1 Tax=Vibrio TaxID=662 RepID=UPI001EFC8785|nr:MULTISPECIES: hypothetical protein [Vibrio]MCG9543541.1 hypothetical protein [Vibrio sp. Isolate33]